MTGRGVGSSGYFVKHACSKHLRDLYPSPQYNLVSGMLQRRIRNSKDEYCGGCVYIFRYLTQPRELSKIKVLFSGKLFSLLSGTQRVISVKTRSERRWARIFDLNSDFARNSKILDIFLKRFPGSFRKVVRSLKIDE